MELAFGLLILVVLLFFAMLPVIILFGMLGMAFKSIGAMILFALKYLLPFGIVGLIVAKLRDMDEWQDYLKHLGIAVGIGLVAVFVWMNIPAAPKLPQPEEVKQVTVSYETYDGTKTTSTQTDWLIDNMVSSLNGASYRRTLKEFIEKDENDYEYTVTMTNSEGKEYTVIFCNYKVLGVRKNGFTSYYMMKDEATVPQDWADNLFTLEKQEKSEALWKPFAQALFSSVAYHPETREVTFVIPETIPEGNYDIDIYIEGSREYTGGEFEPREFFIYEDEQKKDLWEAGAEYSLPLEDICFSKFYIKVKAPYIVEPYSLDVFPLLPEDQVYSK